VELYTKGFDITLLYEVLISSPNLYVTNCAQLSFAFHQHYWVVVGLVWFGPLPKTPCHLFHSAPHRESARQGREGLLHPASFVLGVTLNDTAHTGAFGMIF
jgi:hypothetical protein